MHTLADMIACVRREVAMREGSYPKRIAAGRMAETTAARELSRMESVLELLEALHEAPWVCPECHSAVNPNGKAAVPKEGLI